MQKKAFKKCGNKSNHAYTYDCKNVNFIQRKPILKKNSKNKKQDKNEKRLLIQQFVFFQKYIFQKKSAQQYFKTLEKLPNSLHKRKIAEIFSAINYYLFKFYIFKMTSAALSLAPLPPSFSRKSS